MSATLIPISICQNEEDLTGRSALTLACQCLKRLVQISDFTEMHLYNALPFSNLVLISESDYDLRCMVLKKEDML